MHRHLTPNVLRIATAGFLILGISFMFASSGILYVAQLGSGGGMTTLELPVYLRDDARIESFHGAAFVEPLGNAAASQFAMGMLLIVAGFCFRALWLIRTGHIKANKKKQPHRAAWIKEIKEWMEHGMDKHFHA